ncbi:MAG: M48 family metallopeptidase [Woeseiaceae bacterium]
MQRTARQLPLFPTDQASPDRPDRLPGFAVRVSTRARRLSIKVYPRGKVEVVVPKRTRPADVQSFVLENRDWIDRARRSFGVDPGAETFVLPERIELQAIGESVAVRYLPSAARRTVRYRCAQGLLTLSGRTADEQLCQTALRRWLAETARETFEPRLAALVRLTGISYERLHIRAQRTCWGSHSSSGTISLNLCLLFLPPPVLRYLMLHELCHGRHMNHSGRFWRLVGKYEPDYRRLDQELTESWRSVPAWVGIY